MESQPDLVMGRPFLSIRIRSGLGCEHLSPPPQIPSHGMVITKLSGNLDMSQGCWQTQAYNPLLSVSDIRVQDKENKQGEGAVKSALRQTFLVSGPVQLGKGEL